jgi:hypothetical protein
VVGRPSFISFQTAAELATARYAYHGAPPERGDRPLGVGSRYGANGIVVEREVVGRHPVAGEHLRERALAGLPHVERHGARALSMASATKLAMPRSISSLAGSPS